MESGKCIGHPTKPLPSTNPGTLPSTNPGTLPSTNPGTLPSTNPGTLPSTNPGKPELRDYHTDDQSCIPITKEIMAEYLTVFDGQVRVMEGEQFTITLQEDVIPF